MIQASRKMLAVWDSSSTSTAPRVTKCSEMQKNLAGGETCQICIEKRSESESTTPPEWCIEVPLQLTMPPEMVQASYWASLTPTIVPFSSMYHTNFLSKTRQSTNSSNLREEQGILLPEKGKYATGLMFLNQEQGESSKAQFEEIAQSVGLDVLCWRQVLTDNSCLGKVAKNSEPVITQVFVAPKEECEGEEVTQNYLFCNFCNSTLSRWAGELSDCERLQHTESQKMEPG